MNKIKVLLFDIDGVLLRPPYYYSKILEKQGYTKVEETLNSFYRGDDCKQCVENKADIKTKIAPYLKKIGWTETVNDYLQQQFKFENQYLDKNLITLVKQLKEQGIKCFLSTDQEKIRAKFLLDEMGLKNIFDGYFVSCYIGYRKCHDEFWQHVIEKLKTEMSNIKPEEIVFFDNRQNNIDTALKFKIQAFLFKNISQIKKYILNK